MQISINNRKIGYSDKGKGQVIFLVHGYLETKDVWDDFAARLTDHYRVIAIDLPGHGESDSRGTVNSMELFAGSMKDLLDSLGIKKAFIAGHSMGGYAVLAFRQMFPEYLSAYSLFHSHPFSDKPAAVEKRKMNIEIVHAGKKDTMIPGFVAALYSQYNQKKFSREIETSVLLSSGTKDETIIADLYGMIERPSRLDLIEDGTIPFLWILGRHDSHINADEMLRIVNLPSGSEAFILENSGHMGFIEEADLAADRIRKFINYFSRDNLSHI